MSNLSLIPGQYDRGERLTFAELMAMDLSDVIWAKAPRYEGPLQIQAKDGRFFALTDGDCVAIGTDFPNVADDSPVAVNDPSLGQMEFFRAEPVFQGKD